MQCSNACPFCLQQRPRKRTPAKFSSGVGGHYPVDNDDGKCAVASRTNFGARRIHGGRMKSLFLTSVALIAIGANVVVHAADMPAKALPVITPPYNWSGFYIGANFGGAWTNGSLNIPNNSFYGGLTE